MRKRLGRKKTKKQKKILIIGSLSLLLFLCVGYAAFQTNLSITAKGNIKEQTASELLRKKCNATSGDGLYKDEYEDGRCIYKGTNPNNYITFNNETWRIISLEADNTIKIMRNECISNMIWDSSNSNNWDRPSTLNTYLNEEYLKTITINQDKIVSHPWSIGLIIDDNVDLFSQINDEDKTQSQSTNIGMITVSEYLRANANIEKCGNLNTNNLNLLTCRDTNWMYSIVPSGFLWLLSPSATHQNEVFYVYGHGAGAGDVSDVSTDYTSDGGGAVTPSLYLSADTILKGIGTENSPYIITN